MIKVVYEAQAETIRLVITGHANSAPHGEDLVCAAASAIATGGLNALSHPTSYQIVSKEGLIELNAPHPDDHDRIVIAMMVRQLETLAEAHPRYIRITTKGK